MSFFKDTKFLLSSFRASKLTMLPYALTDILRPKLLMTYLILTTEEICSALDIVNPHSVSMCSSGKQRLILDLICMNAFIYKLKFKCEDFVCDHADI